ncbi:small multidrug resistance protein [Chloroherpeton thalassium ATCC 35110]|uniref:Small multidrug resistance protein n=2 Tax=Chloroherpeton thalassium TaxID=100716 RepID=B3QZ17_CHLT3|nr:small multidrug resistance protein [Chloroherpeton thalassium ATCC 35110]
MRFAIIGYINFELKRSMSWIYLILAILLEVSGTTSMKLSDGFSKFWPSAMIFVFYALSFTSLTYALKELEVSVTYAVWSGLGTVLIALIGIVWFKESVNPMKIISIAVIIIGVIGLNLSHRFD